MNKKEIIKLVLLSSMTIISIGVLLGLLIIGSIKLIESGNTLAVLIFAYSPWGLFLSNKIPNLLNN